MKTSVKSTKKTASKFSVKAESFTNPYGKERDKFAVLSADGEPLNIGAKGSPEAFRAFCDYVKGCGHSVSTWHGVISVVTSKGATNAATIVSLLEQFERNTGHTFSPKAPKASAPKVSAKAAKSESKELQAMREQLAAMQKAMQDMMQAISK